ncbi:MAG: hypothetical protein WBF43_09505 [Methylocella sp.]
MLESIAPTVATESTQSEFPHSRFELRTDDLGYRREPVPEPAKVGVLARSGPSQSNERSKNAWPFERRHSPRAVITRSRSQLRTLARAARAGVRLKQLLDFFDPEMLRLFDFELRAFRSKIVPFDRDAL